MKARLARPRYQLPEYLTTKTAIVAISVGFAWMYFGRSVALIAMDRLDGVAQIHLIELNGDLVVKCLVVLVIGITAIFTPMWAAATWMPRSAPRYSISELALRPWISIILIASMIGVSYFMLSKGIGVTTFPVQSPLPFRLTGILFYTRLLIFPIILCLIAAKTQGRARVPVLLLMVLESFVASASSGSRLIALLHSAPLLYFVIPWLAKSGSFILALLINVNIASRSRNLFLPRIIEGLTNPSEASFTHFTFGVPWQNIPDPVSDPYANAVAVDTALQFNNAFWLPLEYVVTRTQGLPELLMLAANDSACPSVAKSWSQLISFLGFASEAPAECPTVRDALRLPANAFGGFSLDFFGNFWLGSGGNVLLYTFICCFIGILLAMSVVIGRRFQTLVSVRYFSYFICAVVFILLAEGRLQVAIAFLLVVGAGTLFRRPWFRRVRFLAK
jgi:hypothetical protein